MCLSFVIGSFQRVKYLQNIRNNVHIQDCNSHLFTTIERATTSTYTILVKVRIT
jgi:hypothetical protein